MSNKTNSQSIISQDVETIRHSLSHIMAMAVSQIFPGSKLGIGPAIENGFYYDFDLPRTLIPEDLEIISQKMREIIKKDLIFERDELSKDKAISVMKKLRQDYKVEMIQELPENEAISFYKTGDVFLDLCRGPHLKSTGGVGDGWKLLRVAGAYWKGDEKNKMLQRIYGVAFLTKKELDAHLLQLAEAEKRDHRRLGKDLDLFIFDEEVGAGLPLWLPKGAMLRHKIMDFALQTYLEKGYELVCTPHFASSKLWQHSGHLDFYAENMFASFGVEEEEYRLKPMNCPLHVRMYKSRQRSYRELPIRWTEMGTVYRYERTGVLHGLSRVRGFTQDDAHIICTKDQLEKELSTALELTLYLLKTLGFTEYEVNISVRDLKHKEKFIGSDENWQVAEKVLMNVLENSGFKDYVLDAGGAVFYGPKIDVKVSDAIGRKWQLSTIQFDFNLPSKFKMTYVDETGKEKIPYMIHRALLGSLERFIGVLIEHYAGKFPVWLAPVQAVLVPISDSQNKYAEKVAKDLKAQNLRVEIDDRRETMQAKIRDAQMKHVPYMLVVGEREKEAETVAPRRRDGKKIEVLKIEDFSRLLKKEVENKVIW